VREPRKKISEVDLAAKVIAWLEADSWDVYQEVDGIDIVAVRGSLLWIVECKLILNFHVLEQAMYRRAQAHCIWVATPPRRQSRQVVKKFCSYAGIGWIVVPDRRDPRVYSRPEFNRRAMTDRLRRLLRPEQKTYAAAGSPTGRAWTPYKETCNLLLCLVKTDPGITLRKAMSKIKHHYRNESSARRTMADRLETGIVPGIKFERKGREIFLYPI